MSKKNIAQAEAQKEDDIVEALNGELFLHSSGAEQFAHANLANTAIAAIDASRKKKSFLGGYKYPYIFEDLLRSADILVAHRHYGPAAKRIYKHVAEELKDAPNVRATGFIKPKPGEFDLAGLAGCCRKAVRAISDHLEHFGDRKDQFDMAVWLVPFYYDLTKDQQDELPLQIHNTIPMPGDYYSLAPLEHVLVSSLNNPERFGYDFQYPLIIAYILSVHRYPNDKALLQLEGVMNRIKAGSSADKELCVALDHMVEKKENFMPAKTYMAQALRTREGSLLSAHSISNFKSFWNGQSQEAQERILKTVLKHRDENHPLCRALMARQQEPVAQARKKKSIFGIFKLKIG